ncbi:MAG: CoB--CoM heterodisulfide reductase iron-sulfur subunit B family protein [Betaproteobacteria bacterium]|nr:CoB--CoM heterodisulfide reductase iron-sulfur subunit B family protein [Betaproteobacteria bacterium]
MKLAYYPGCTLKNHARNFDATTVASMARLGVEVQELPRWNCCGTVHGLAGDDLIHRAAPLTNLIRVKETRASEFMTGCAMCYNTLKRANQHVRKDAAALATLNDFLSLEETKYAGDVDVFHLLEFLRDRVGFEQLAAKVTKPLKDLRVACYYGCMLVRPKEVAFDDGENPTIMENLVAALGATPVPFALKAECCGAYHVVGRPEIVAERTGRIMESALKDAADVVVVSCPLCAHNLDHRQEDAKCHNPDFHGLPVLYFTQLMAIALGCDDAAQHFELHHHDPQPVLAGRGLV